MSVSLKNDFENPHTNKYSNPESNFCITKQFFFIYHFDSPYKVVFESSVMLFLFIAHHMI